MRLAILGGTGKVGKHLLEQAVAAGHSLQVLARTPDKVAVRHDLIEVIPGDIKDPEATERAVKGTDAVISALGPGFGSKDPDLMRTAGRNILSAMTKHQVRRLVVLIGAFVPHPKDAPSLFRPLAAWVLKTFTVSHGDILAYIDQVRGSDLDWTVGRFSHLLDGPRTGTYRADYGPPGFTSKLRLADAADFALRAVTERSFIHESPFVRY